MTTTTTQQAATAAPGVQVGQTSSADAPTEDTFQSLWDKGAFAPTDEQGNTLSADEQQRQEREAQGGEQHQETETEGETEPDKGAKPKEGEQTKPDDEGEEYASLEQYLDKNKLDPESFNQLETTVTVDGKSEQVSLGELKKGYQLAQASYNRMNELAGQRTQFTQEQGQIRQALGVRIQQIEGVLKAAQDQLVGDYNAITPQQWAELRATKPDEYAAAITDFNQRQQTLQQIFQRVAQARQAESQAANQQRLQALPAERERLYQARPEWRDTTKFAAAQAKMREVGRKLGFTDAELNSVYDHRYLLILDLAARADGLQASQPNVLKRVRAAPKMAAAGTRQARSGQQAGYRRDVDAWARNPNDTNAAIAVFDHF